MISKETSKKMYDLASFGVIAESAVQVKDRALRRNPKALLSGFMDSDPGLVLARQLEFVDPTILSKEFPDNVFLNSGIQMDNSGGFVERIKSLRLIAEGDFVRATDKTTDKSKISLKAEDNFIQVHPFEAFSEWSETEVKQNALQNINLVQQLIEKANFKYLRKIDEIGLRGIKDISGAVLFPGLLNSTSFITTGAVGAAPTLDAQQLYDAFSTLITNQWADSNNTSAYMATRVIMPNSVMNIISKKIFSQVGNFNRTVFEALKTNFPRIEFISSFRAEADSIATPPVLSSTVAYNVERGSMVMRLPQPLTIGQIIFTGSFTQKMDYAARVGGLDVLDITSGRILTGL